MCSAVDVWLIERFFPRMYLQELERQALEQYKNSESSLSSTDSIRAGSSPTTWTKTDRDDDGRGQEDEPGEDGTRCPGFGNRGCSSPGNDNSSERGDNEKRCKVFCTGLPPLLQLYA